MRLSGKRWTRAIRFALGLRNARIRQALEAVGFRQAEAYELHALSEAVLNAVLEGDALALRHAENRLWRWYREWVAIARVVVVPPVLRRQLDLDERLPRRWRRRAP